MTALIYLAAAVLCAAMGLRAWLEDRRDPVRRAFFQVALLASVCFVAFLAYLFDRAAPTSLAKYGYVLGGVALPFLLLHFLERTFRPHSQHRNLSLPAVAVGVGLVALDATFFRSVPRASVAEVLAGLVSLGGFSLCIRMLFRERHRLDDNVERARILYPAVFLSLTAGFTLLEQLGRALSFVTDLTGPRAALRMVNDVQGPVPPLSALFGVATIYLLLQVVRISRLLDLHEILARAVTVAVSALALVVIQGALVIWTESLPSHRIHGTFQIFLLAVAFLTVYEPMRARVESFITRHLNDPGARLERTLAQVDQGLAAVITLDGLDRELLARLHTSGRAPVVSLYLWDAEVEAYRLVRQRGEADPPLIRAIPAGPFTDTLADVDYGLIRSDLERVARRRLQDAERAITWLRTLDTMDADLTLPLRSGEMVLGWLNLRAEQGTDGFSNEEVRRLGQTVDRAAVLVGNIHSFEKLKEQHRLAALGEMAAGMAHEIRNPLASIKGAAQFLETIAPDEAEDESRDFLDIIVHEVDRLDGVVTQFLDYSRTARLQREPTDLAELVRRVIDQVKVGDLPPGIEIELAVPDQVPPVPLDANRIRQVLLNLLRNAVQAVGDAGTVRVTVQRGYLSAPGRSGARAVDVVVRDDGPGIEPELLDKLFIPFFTTRRDGTGLGLPISQRLVEAHGGELTVRTEKGAGSVFTVRLPVEAGITVSV